MSSMSYSPLFSPFLSLYLFLQSGFQVLARRASEERFQQRAEQDQTYHGVSGINRITRFIDGSH